MRTGFWGLWLVVVLCAGLAVARDFEGSTWTGVGIGHVSRAGAVFITREGNVRDAQFSGLDLETVIQVDMEPYSLLLFDMPEGFSARGDYDFVGVRVVMTDAPREAEQDDGWWVNEAVEMEIIGKAFYGRIAEVAGEMITLEPFAEDSRGPVRVHVGEGADVGLVLAVGVTGCFVIDEENELVYAREVL